MCRTRGRGDAGPWTGNLPKVESPQRGRLAHLIQIVAYRRRIDIANRPHTIGQLRQVYGAAMDPEKGWMTAEDVYEVMIDPTKCPDHETAARYYLNRWVSGQDAWIPDAIVERQQRLGRVVHSRNFLE